MTDYVTPTTWEQCAAHVEAGGIVEVFDGFDEWLDEGVGPSGFRSRPRGPGIGTWEAPRRLVPIETEAYRKERRAIDVPDGYEAVWLPSETVDEFGAGEDDRVSRGHVVAGAREAQARRGTTPAPSPAPDDLVSRARRHAETHPESRELIEELLEVVVTEDDLRRIVERSARLGDWDEWTKTALGGYNALTVTARAVLGHLHGQHDDSALPYSHCLLCELFRDARRGSTPAPSPVPPWPDGVLRDAANRLRWIADSGYIEDPGIKRIIRSWADELDATPVPPWPGAVLSGCVDEDGVPTWLAQAGQVRGEQVRIWHGEPWGKPHGSWANNRWVEVRAPRAVPAPETERVPWWEANDRELVDGLLCVENAMIREVGREGDRVYVCGYEDPDNPDEDDRGDWKRNYWFGRDGFDGTVEVLKDGDR